MKLKPLKIRHLEVKYPVIQAGMGVRIGNSRLSAETINQGGLGTIATVGLGDVNTATMSTYLDHALEYLPREIHEARRLSGNKPGLGVNIMVALTIYQELVECSVREGVDFIISGAGLPLNLPEFVGDANVALIPVVSGGRALEIVLRCWLRKYNRKPDALILEGPKCGGHLGFSMEQIENPDSCSLEIILAECREVMKKYDVDVPLLAAGEVCCKADIENFIRMGFDGVQIGTHFLTAEEAGIDNASKQVFIDAKAEDIVIIKSPVGLPVRVLRTPLVQRVLAGQREQFVCPYHCLRTCNPRKVPFCIAKALLATWSGDTDNGLYMCGCNIESVKKIYPLREFFATLEGE